MLADIYGWFTEGFDTFDLKPRRAYQMLDVAIRKRDLILSDSVPLEKKRLPTFTTTRGHQLTKGRTGQERLAGLAGGLPPEKPQVVR